MSKPTVQVITLHRVHNFGSALQTVATERLLNGAGFDATVIDYWRPSELDSVEDQLAHNYRRWARNPATRSAFRALRGSAIRRQGESFRNFVEREITTTDRIYLSESELEQSLPTSDFYCVGSDQVWNTDYHTGDQEPFFLRFAPEGAKKFSFASSFGRPTLSGREEAFVSEDLSNFDHVSVRERSGVELLQARGIAATQLVDPTLALDDAAWSSKAESVTDEDYVLVYQLHRSHDLTAAVEEACKRVGARPLYLRGYWTPFGTRGRSIADTTVPEFLGLLRGARYIVTDSFHGTAFSLNFGKPFTPVLPPNYGERISSLLSLTGTLDRVRTEASSPSEMGDLDVSTVHSALDVERAKVSSYLAKVLRG